MAGTDGVSLETAKWVKVLTMMGHECFFFAGECDWPSDRTHIVPEAHFNWPEMIAINKELFSGRVRSPRTSERIESLKRHLKTHVQDFIRTFGLRLLIVENALSLPMNVPLGLAITEVIAETGIPAVAHHHDFAWERDRFSLNAAEDYLRTAFPPVLPSLHHVVINSFGGRQLALRTGASSSLIPNVMDFDTPPPALDDYAAELRPALGLKPEQRLLLQPTRVVPRKRIERAIELTRYLNTDAVLVVSHDVGDEGTVYLDYLREYARVLGVPVLFAAGIIGHDRATRADGRKIFSLSDVYQQADLVTYPSRLEGFGNAFLEAIYYQRPIVMGTYEIFRTDIQPKGFKVIGFEDFITGETIHQALAILMNAEAAAEMTDHNFELGRRYYGYKALETNLANLLSECLVE